MMARSQSLVYTLEPLSDCQKEEIRRQVTVDVCTLQRRAIVESAIDFADVECLICRDRDDIEQILDCCPNIKFLYVVSAGVERLPFSRLRGRGVTVCNAGGVNAEAMSQYAIAQILAYSTKIRENLVCQQKRIWIKFQCTDDIRGKRLFVAGAGRSGTLLATKAKAFGMVVIGANLPPKRTPPFDEVLDLDAFDDRIGEADYVVCALPLTSRTECHFDYSLFCRMKPVARFINMSRGKLVDKDGLLKALRERRIASATLDVFDVEPIPDTDCLWEAPNLYITPHMAGRTSNFMDEAIKVFCLNYLAFLKHVTMPNRIDLDNGF